MYTLCVVCRFAFAFNPSALVERRVDADEIHVSHQYPYIDSWFVVGDPVSPQESCKQKEDR